MRKSTLHPTMRSAEIPELSNHERWELTTKKRRIERANEKRNEGYNPYGDNRRIPAICIECKHWLSRQELDNTEYWDVIEGRCQVHGTQTPPVFTCTSSDYKR